MSEIGERKALFEFLRRGRATKFVTSLRGRVSRRESRDPFVELHQSHPAQEKPGAGLPLSRNDETTCPCCKGTLGQYQHFDMPDEYGLFPPEHVDSDECECMPHFHECLACYGTGELTGLRRATILARGDIAPVQRRGFA